MTITARKPCPCGSGKKYKQCCGQQLAREKKIQTLMDQALVAMKKQNFERAYQGMEEAALLNPKDGEVWLLMGYSALYMNRNYQAAEALSKALPLCPDKQAKVSIGLGMAWHELGKNDKALLAFTHATENLTESDPENQGVVAWWGRSFFLLNQGEAVQAEAALEQVLLREPKHLGALINRSAALKLQNRWTKAIHYAEKATVLSKTDPVAWMNLALLCQEWGDHQRAMEIFQRLMQEQPENQLVQSSYLYGLNYFPHWTEQQRCAEAVRWGTQLQALAEQQHPKYTQWPQARLHTSLSIGFISGDFRQHPVGYFLRTFLLELQSADVHTVAYMTADVDQYSSNLSECFSSWNLVMDMNDRALAEQIHADGVQILIDLSGHSRSNRLKVFCWRPAPVQLTWLGYFATTGMPQMDYILVDPWVVPIDTQSPHFSEQPVWLADTYRCYSLPTVNPLSSGSPILETGRMTFGCFNHLNKLNNNVLQVWGRILQALPNAQLFLKARQLGDSEDREQFIQRAQACGIRPEQLLLEGVSDFVQYMGSYNRVDLALDPFPYTGATVSLEGLSMGVPMLSLEGQDMLSRSGVQILQSLNLQDFIAYDVDDYVQKALTWAAQPERLRSIRLALPQQMRTSVLCDAPLFTQRWLDSMQQLWQRWKDSASDESV